jgi:hypothetical protein
VRTSAKDARSFTLRDLPGYQERRFMLLVLLLAAPSSGYMDVRLEDAQRFNKYTAEQVQECCVLSRMFGCYLAEKQLNTQRALNFRQSSLYITLSRLNDPRDTDGIKRARLVSLKRYMGSEAYREGKLPPPIFAGHEQAFMDWLSKKYREGLFTSEDIRVAKKEPTVQPPSRISIQKDIKLEDVKRFKDFTPAKAKAGKQSADLFVCYLAEKDRNLEANLHIRVQLIYEHLGLLTKPKQTDESKLVTLNVLRWLLNKEGYQKAEVPPPVPLIDEKDFKTWLAGKNKAGHFTPDAIRAARKKAEKRSVPGR